MTEWRDIKNLPLDKDRWPIAFRARVLCNCARGGEIITTGAVQGGMVICDCGHDIQFTHFIYLPVPAGADACPIIPSARQGGLH